MSARLPLHFKKRAAVPDNQLTPRQYYEPIRLAVWQSHAIAAAAELGVADALAEGPLPLAEIATRTRTDAPSLYRLLRALGIAGVFAETSPNIFGNTVLSDRLRSKGAESLRGWVLMNLSDLDGGRAPGMDSPRR
jgi:Dimerisation domain